MTDQRLSVAFHVGAHKTATSHLQRSLGKVADALATHGVRYYGPKHFRVPGGTIPTRFGFRTNKDNAPPEFTPAEQLAVMRKDGHRLVLSEENFVGALNHPQGFPQKLRYPEAGHRLARLAAAIDHEIDVFVAVRRPTGFLNSAYCQMLLGGRLQSLEMYQKRNPISSVDWVHFIAGIRAAKGVREVNVWRYEDYADVFPQITAGMVGAGAVDVIAPIPRYVNRGLSADAVADVLTKTGEVSSEKLAFAARKTFSVEDGHSAFDGYTAQEHEIGDEVYARQIKSIAELEGVTFLRPEPS